MIAVEEWERSMTKPEDAPYRFIWSSITLDGKVYAMYHLGKEGKEMLENSVCKEQMNNVEDRLLEQIETQREMIAVLTNIIGRSKLIEHLKTEMLLKLNVKCHRKYELVTPPFYAEKALAFNELTATGKVEYIKAGGWFKLKQAPNPKG